MPPDSHRVCKTLAFLLRHRPDVGGLTATGDGWYSLGEVTRAVCRITRLRLSERDLARMAIQDPQGGFLVEQDRIRAGQRRRKTRHAVPDIVYLPATRRQAEAVRGAEDIVADPRNPLRLHVREHHAWLAAHRTRADDPTVLYIDANRATRAGVEFRRMGTGVYAVDRLPVRFVLNLRPGFGIQVSAGGFLVRRTPDGRDEVALVRVRRKSGVTWEVAKGKLEVGESPVDTAIRELREEMGLDVPLEVDADLGVSHYGFTTPAGEPRLKVLHLFVLRPRGSVGDFHPALSEGIEAVAFFPPGDLGRLVTHGSLKDPVRRLRRFLQQEERPLGPTGPDAQGDPGEE